jgi:hypothetical protein
LIQEKLHILDFFQLFACRSVTLTFIEPLGALGRGATAMRAMIFAAMMSIASVSWGFDASSLDLTPGQIQALETLKARGFTDEQLQKAAEAMQRHNKRPAVYVPEHTAQDLILVAYWAQGGAFASFADFAGMKFLAEPYKAACPNREIFNFGRATGKQYFHIDILDQAYRLASALQIMLATDREGFRDRYLKMAKEKGFLQYLTPIDL